MRVVLPSLPLQTALTPVAPILKTVLSMPPVNPRTEPSKVSSSATFSPTLLPAVPTTAVVVTTGGADASSGAVVSREKVSARLGVLTLPATSVIVADRLLLPSGPRSAAATLKSTWPAARCAAVSVTALGVAKAWPSSLSSRRSPATGSDPVVGSVTRKLVLCASAALMRPSARSALPCSARAGAAGAVASSVKTSASLCSPALPALSVTTAVRLLAPSTPRSPAMTVKSTNPLATSVAVSVADFGVGNARPPRRRSIRSPATAGEPVVGSATRKTVLCASSAFMRVSARSLLPCSATVGAPSATVSTTGSGVLSMSGSTPPFKV